MGRKNLSSQRKSELIDAFEECIIKYGLAEATLQKTAEMANVNLGTIHHYIGNRDDLLKAMLERFAEKAKSDNTLFLKIVPAKIHFEYLLEHLFKSEDPRTDRILNELFSASEHNQLIKDLLHKINKEYLNIIAKELISINKMSESDASDLAYLLLSLIYGSDILNGVGISKRKKTLINLSKVLITNVKEGKK